MEWLWLKMLGSLLLIVGLIVATLWILKRFMTFGKPASASGIAMDIAGVLHLAPRRSVYAVKTGGQVILLGVAEHGGITFLTQMPESAFSSCGSGLQPGVHIPTVGGVPSGISPFLTMLVERFKTGNAPAFQTPATVQETVAAHESELQSSDAAFYEPEPAPEPIAPVKKKRSSAASRKKTSIQ